MINENVLKYLRKNVNDTFAEALVNPSKETERDYWIATSALATYISDMTHDEFDDFYSGDMESVHYCCRD
jgi:hypothetical protein